MPPAVDEVLDGLFRVERRLGAGAAGDVFAVTLERLWQGLPAGRRLALKWYSPRILGREPEATVMARRLREASLGARIRHPNLVRTFELHDLWADGRPRYLLMEFVEGRSLEEVEEVLGRSPLPGEAVFSIMEQLSGGVAALHAAGVVHRDIKPANIVVRPDGSVVLLDLGVARPRAEETVTESRAFLGTLCYAAPEWLFGESYSPAADIYSLGGVLYRLLTGRGLFEDVRPFARQVLAVQNTIPELPRRHTDPALAFASTLAAHMLTKEPEARPSVEDIREFFLRRAESATWQRLRTERIEMLQAECNKDRGYPLAAAELLKLPGDVLDLRLATLDHAAATLDLFRRRRLDTGLLGAVVKRSDEEARLALAEKLLTLGPVDREELLEAASATAVNLVPEVERLLDDGVEEPALLAYLVKKSAAGVEDRLRAIEAAAEALGLSGGERQAYVWNRSRFRSEIRRRLAEMEVEILEQKELVDSLEPQSEWDRKAWREELSRAVAFVRSRPAEAVRKRISDLESDISSHGAGMGAEQDALQEFEDVSPDDRDGYMYHWQEYEKASLEHEALTAAAKLLESDTVAATAEEALRTVLAGFEVRTAKERAELERLLEEYLPLRRLELAVRRASEGLREQNPPPHVESFLKSLGKLGERLRGALWRG